MIGCGFVGSASVFALMQSGVFTEIVLIDADKNKAEGEAMDISPVTLAYLIAESESTAIDIPATP